MYRLCTLIKMVRGDMATVRDRHERSRLCFDMLVYRNSRRKVVYQVKRKMNRLVDIFLYSSAERSAGRRIDKIKSFELVPWAPIGGYMITNHSHV